MDTDDNAELFEKYNVLTTREFKSRNEIYLEKYVKEVNIESRLALRIAKTMLFPAAVASQNQLAQTSISLKSLGKEHCTTVLDELNALLGKLQGAMAKLDAAINHESKDGLLSHAKHLRDEVIPAMVAVRQLADKVEGIVSDDLWPLPTYQEMLFIK